MSGPKVSEYSISTSYVDYSFEYDDFDYESEQRREEERRYKEMLNNERNRIQEVRRELGRLERTVADFKYKMQEYERQYNIRREKYKGNADALAGIENAYSIFSAQCKSMISSVDRKSTEGIQSGIDKLNATDCFDVFVESMDEVCKLSQKTDEKKFVIPESLKIRCEIKEAVAEKSLTEILDELEAEKNKGIAEKAQLLLFTADELEANDLCIRSDEAVIADIRGKLNSIIEGNFSEDADRYIATQTVVLKGISEYVKMYKDYQAYMISSDLKPVDIKRFYTRDKLKRQVEITRKEYLEREQARYVSMAIDEVMQSLGYDIMTDVCVKGVAFTDPDISDSIYENQDGTHIRAFVNPNGITVMEIVGDSSTEKQRNERYKEQVAFCKLFPEIITELESRYGIVLNKVEYKELQMECKEIEHINKSQENSGERRKRKTSEIERSIK